MVNFQTLDFLRFFFINCVTTGALELNGISQTVLDPIIQSANERVLDDISSGLVRMLKLSYDDRSSSVVRPSLPIASRGGVRMHHQIVVLFFRGHF